jgi:hypothetical protein
MTLFPTAGVNLLSPPGLARRLSCRRCSAFSQTIYDCDGVLEVFKNHLAHAHNLLPHKPNPVLAESLPYQPGAPLTVLSNGQIKCQACDKTFAKECHSLIIVEHLNDNFHREVGEDHDKCEIGCLSGCDCRNANTLKFA